MFTPTETNKFTFFLTPTDPVVHCTIGDSNKSSFDGKEVLFLQQLIHNIGWAENTYEFEFLSISDLMSKTYNSTYGAVPQLLKDE